MLELETWLELEILLELELELRLELEMDELLLELLLLLEDTDELLITISELLETDEEDGITTGRLELLIAADEDTTADDELEGGFSGAWLLEIADRLLDVTEELLDEDFTEDIAVRDDEVLPDPSTMVPPPQAANAAERDTTETIRNELLRRFRIALPIS